MLGFHVKMTITVLDCVLSEVAHPSDQAVESDVGSINFKDGRTGTGICREGSCRVTYVQLPTVDRTSTLPMP